MEQLGISQQADSNQLRELGKIQKTSRYISHELNDREMEQGKNTHDILLARYKRK